MQQRHAWVRTAESLRLVAIPPCERAADRVRVDARLRVWVGAAVAVEGAETIPDGSPVGDEVRVFLDCARGDRLYAVWRLSLLALRP